MQQRKNTLESLDLLEAKQELEKVTQTLKHYLFMAKKFGKGHLLQENKKVTLSERMIPTIKDLALKFNKKH